MLRRNLLFVQKYNLHTCSSRLSSADVLRKDWNEARVQGNVRRQVWRGCDFEGFRKFAAGQLGASEKTMKVHRGQVMRKMQAESLAALIRMGEKLGIRVPDMLTHRTKVP